MADEHKQEKVVTLNESKSDIILGVVFLVFSLALLFVIIPTQIADVGAEFPSPRFFSRMCGVLMLVLSILLLLQGVRKKAKMEKDPGEVVTFHTSGVRRSALILLVQVVAVAALTVLPYVPVTIVMLLALMLILGQRKKVILIGVSVILPLLVYFFFTYGLRLVLP